MKELQSEFKMFSAEDLYKYYGVYSEGILESSPLLGPM